MAIYHLEVKTGTRDGGQSASAKCDYIQRKGKYATHNKDQTVIYTQSGNMPKWAADDSGLYWQAADNHERANGRLFKELIGSVPKELDRRQQIALGLAFARALTEIDVTESGKTKRIYLPFTIAFHEGENGENPHFHLMVSERVNDGIERSAEEWFRRANKKNPAKGGAAKTTVMKPKDWLLDTRKLWADMANAALKKANQSARIDHRTLAAQGINRRPILTLRPRVAGIERRKGITTRTGDEMRRRQAERDAYNQAQQQMQAAEPKSHQTTPSWISWLGLGKKKRTKTATAGPALAEIEAQTIPQDEPKPQEQPPVIRSASLPGEPPAAPVPAPAQPPEIVPPEPPQLGQEQPEGQHVTPPPPAPAPEPNMSELSPEQDEIEDETVKYYRIRFDEAENISDKENIILEIASDYEEIMNNIFGLSDEDKIAALRLFRLGKELCLTDKENLRASSEYLDLVRKTCGIQMEEEPTHDHDSAVKGEKTPEQSQHIRPNTPGKGRGQ